MLKSWHMPKNEDVVNQFSQNFVGDVDLDKFCANTGIQYYRFDPETLNENEEFNRFKASNGFTYEDQVVVSPDKMGPEYNNKLKIFFSEHLHTDDEVRFIMDGSGYFDVRDEQDNWVRLWTKRGDLIVLPAGVYHRFTTDENHYIHALRLFVGEPVWTPYNRPADDLQSRLDYIKKFYKF